MCTYINGIINGDAKYGGLSQTCIVSGNAVCGDGVRANGGGEACDDGNSNSGDGCSSSCTVECGHTCAENAAKLSTCTASCGNGAVDYINYEECDDTSAFCSSFWL